MTSLTIVSTDAIKLIVTWASPPCCFTARAAIQAMRSQQLHTSSARHGALHVLKLEQTLSRESNRATSDASVLGRQGLLQARALCRCQEVLHSVQVVGLDAEWKPNTSGEQNPISILQVCLSPFLNGLYCLWHCIRPCPL